jgi:hypothetical protein
MPEELISFHTQARGDIKLPLYLTECYSWGGHSGSPAYWYNELKVGDTVKIDGKAHQVVVGQHYVVGLLGLVTGHFDSTQATTLGTSVKTQVKVNAGIAMVTPADYIVELLMRDDVQEDRSDRVAKSPKKKSTAAFDAAAVVLDSETQTTRRGAIIPVPPRKQFETDLPKAIRKRKP